MRKFTRYGLAAGLAAGLLWGLTGCGGNDSLPPKTSVTKVYVIGDSLADVGTFGGVKFTVQDPVNPKNSLVWPQIIANNYGLDGSAQCNFYTFTGTVFAANSTPGCTNFAIGGARIYNDATSVNPLNVGVQMATKALFGNYASTDLVLIDAGGNDAADLVTAFLTAAADPTNATNANALQTFLKQQISVSDLGSLLTQDSTGATAAGAYMKALANTFYDSVTSQVLAKGATKVGILNIPDITVTPRFQAVLATMDSAKAGQVQFLIRSWISAFNTQLKARIGTDTKVALVDFYSDIQDQVANRSSYALDNVTAPVCTVTTSFLGNFPCLSTALDAVPGKTAGWWKRYAFSDGFHPTPFAHGLLAASVSRALARAGWL